MNKNNITSQKEAPIRLNKYIASCGICARRKADELISEGKISVNDKIVNEMGFMIKGGETVKLSGKVIKPILTHTYILLNKPKGYLTTRQDPENRKTIYDLLPKDNTSLFSVGRLDYMTSGLIIITNDGDFAQQVSHPSFETQKLYVVTLSEKIRKNDFETIQKGVLLEDGIIKPDKVAVVDNLGFEIGIEIHSGKNRVVRRIFESLNYEVKKLDRVMIGSLTKKNIPRGKFRYLSSIEVDNFRKKKNEKIFK